MRWIAKALVQGTLSRLPRGAALNYMLQRHETRNLPAPVGIFRLPVDGALEHFHALRRHAPALEPRDAVLYEFGAGWDLIGPVTLAMSGIGRQIVVDIRANLRLELVNDTLRRLPALLDGRLRSVAPISTIDELETRLGIRYVAPCDARDTGMPASSVDMISSTYTLEHIPASDIAAILRESARLLRPGGLVSCAIDMKDHYSYFDDRLSPYHFLSVPDRAWRFVNSDLHYQNRLRLPDYHRLFAAAGLTTIAEDVKQPTDFERRQLDGIELAPRFRGYGTDDLAALELRLLCTR
jgi:SAM-dependent methyltransferase